MKRRAARLGYQLVPALASDYYQWLYLFPAISYFRNHLPTDFYSFLPNYNTAKRFIKPAIRIFSKYPNEHSLDF